MGDEASRGALRALGEASEVKLPPDLTLKNRKKGTVATSYFSEIASAFSASTCGVQCDTISC